MAVVTREWDCCSSVGSGGSTVMTIMGRKTRRFFVCLW